MHTAREYVSFIVLLGSLFVISGCIHVQGSLSGTPLVNTGMLAFGAVLANLVGTTGASVLLVRPLLQANAQPPNKIARLRVLHLRRLQLRRIAHAAGRPAAVPRLSQRRAVRVDVAAAAAMGLRQLACCW